MQKLLFTLVLLSLPGLLLGNTVIGSIPPSLLGIRVEFILFGLTLVGVAWLHKHSMLVALAGLTAVMVWKLLFDPGFELVGHFLGAPGHEGEWKILLNLLGLLFGFTILANHFEKSGIPGALPSILPGSWIGGLILLVIIFAISSFLDNIAAAIIGGTIAQVVYRGRVHIGFVAAIIAASNAGGSGSVVGDTTTMMMWIDGVGAGEVLKAYVGAIVALLIFGTVAARQQHNFSPIDNHHGSAGKLDLAKIIIVLLILTSAIIANWMIGFPAIGVWLAILAGATFSKTNWSELHKATKGTVFLLSLVFTASLMPVSELPSPSWQTAFGLGFVSAFFDNIPLTKLCLEQGGYDWGILAFTVGFGGSMIWFGSSAGVALSNIYPESRNTLNYLKNSWHIVVAYVIGFFFMLAIAGWNPNGQQEAKAESERVETNYQ